MREGWLEGVHQGTSSNNARVTITKHMVQAFPCELRKHNTGFGV